jgi:hypothetical protein
MADAQRDLENAKSGEPGKTKRERSPSFPFISLPRAIERIKSFDANHKRNATRVVVAAETWHYGPKSSGALQTIAALKAYGLLEDVGGSDDRRVQLTELANRILRDSRPGAREQAIRDAALRPRLIGEYVRRWCPDRPSDTHRVSELHLDRRFTEEAARNFIKVFDDTISYAALDKTDSDAESRPDNEIAYEVEGQGSDLGQSSQRSDQGRLAEPADSGPKHLTERAIFPLPEGLVVLEVPTQLSQASYQDLEAWMEVMLRRIKRSVKIQ